MLRGLHSTIPIGGAKPAARAAHRETLLLHDASMALSPRARGNRTALARKPAIERFGGRAALRYIAA